MGLFLLIDMDYFFAACEELRHHEYKDKALVVGTSSSENKEKGVVQTCNYIARQYGIHSAMSISDALKLNPNLTYLASDEAYYEQISHKLEHLIRSRNLRMEVMSIDEIAIETNNDNYAEALALAESIKEEINSNLGLPCTIGVSSAIVYAKMVCDAYKPNKIGVVRREDLVNFIKDKEVKAIIGVGVYVKLNSSTYFGMTTYTPFGISLQLYIWSYIFILLMLSNRMYVYKLENADELYTTVLFGSAFM